MSDSNKCETYYFEDDADKTVKANERLIYHVLAKIIHRSDLVSDDDIIQCGRLGIFKAWKYYDSSTSSWSTYVIQVMKNEILMELRKRNNSKNFFYSTCDSLNRVIDDGSGGTCELQDLIAFRDNSLDSIILDHENQWKTIYDALSSRDKKIIYLLDLKYNQKEIGEILGISQSYASRLIRSLKKRVLKKWEEMNNN